MDKDVETVGMEIEDEKEIKLTPSFQLVIEENNEVYIYIIVALNCVKLLKDFYYCEPNNVTMYNYLLEIEQNLQEKYCL